MDTVIHIFSHASLNTTARYFFNAIRDSNLNVVYWSDPPNLNSIRSKDILFFIDPVSFWPFGLEKVNFLKIAYFIDVHQQLNSRISISKFFDISFIAQSDYIPYFLEAGSINVKWLPLACDPTLYKPNNDRTLDISFVGNFGPIDSNRFQILNSVQNKFSSTFLGEFINPNEMISIYQNSKIVFNTSINKDLNMRFFEGLASGALLITDRINNGLNELFVEDIHYVGYSSIEEALKKIEYYLVHEDEREQIALAGSNLALRSHSYSNRWQEILSIIQKNISKCAPVQTMGKSDLINTYAEILMELRRPFAFFNLFKNYGLSAKSLRLFILSLGRVVNQVFPLTPAAFKYKISKVRAKKITKKLYSDHLQNYKM